MGDTIRQLTTNNPQFTADMMSTDRKLRWTPGTILAIAIAVIFTGCAVLDHDKANPDVPFTIPAVHTRYLEYPVPSYGLATEFNPPVLRWPVVKGKFISYDVRLSKDSTFTRGAVIAVEGTPWAMFNPHQELDPGRWYWQYRVSEKDWSAVQRFVVEVGANELIAPSAEVFLKGIPRTHPRILTEEQEIGKLRNLVDHKDAIAILADADLVLNNSIPRETDGASTRALSDNEKARKLKQDASNVLGKRVYTSVASLCQATLLSGEDRYRERAIAISLEVARWDPNGVTGHGTSDFSDARCMLSMALVLDTFYEHLSDEQRSLLTHSIKLRANGFYESWINNQESRLLSGHLWQHILHYFFQTALALHGHEPDADLWLSYAYELFVARTPVLGGVDGGWVEGASYFRMNMETVIDIPLFIKKYTGFDFIKAHPWYVNNVDWMIYHIPPGSSSDGFGDNAEEVWSPGMEYVVFAREIAKLTGSRLASWYAEQCERYEKSDPSTKDILRWIRLTKTGDLLLPEPLVDPVLPSGKVFRDIGLASMHSDPANTSRNLMVAVRSSPFGCYGHFLADQNALNVLFAGQRTFFRTGYKVTMTDPHRTGWYQHTKSNNSVLVDGHGQPYSTEAFGWIRGFIAGSRIGYTLADASNAYSSRETNENYGVKKFLRHIILLKPDVIVIYDELEAAHAVEWSWLIHSMAAIQVDQAGNSFRSDFNNVRGAGRLWASKAFDFVLRDTFDVPAVNWRGSKDMSGKMKRYDAEQWHLKARSLSPARAMRFLSVIQISQAGTEPRIVEGDQDTPLTIAAGGWTLTAELDINKPPAISIINDAKADSFTYSKEEGPSVMEVRDGQERSLEAGDIRPLSLRQSELFYKNRR